MGEPAIKSNTDQSSKQTITPRQAEKLLKDLNDLSQKNLNALNGLIGDVPPSMAATIAGSLKAGMARTETLIDIYKMGDNLDAYKKASASGNHLMAGKSLADMSKTTVQVVEKVLKSNVDVALLVAQRKEMVGAVAQLKKVSEKLGNLGRVASVIGAVGGTLQLIDAIHREDTGAALQAGVSIAEGVGAAIGGAAPLGQALATPLRMVLVFGQVGGMLKSIRNQAIREQTALIVKRGDRLLTRARVADVYRTLYHQAMVAGEQGETLQYRKALLHDWGRQVGGEMLALMRAMDAMDRRLQTMRGREFSQVDHTALQRRIETAADPLGQERRQQGRATLSGREVAQDWGMAQAVLDATAGFVVTRLLEAEVIPWHRFAEVQLKMYRTWRV